MYDNDRLYYLLSPSGQDISNIIGISALQTLSKHLGGIRVLVPRRYEKWRYYSKLCHLIGDKATKRLCRCYQGQWLYIPACQTLNRVQRDAEVLVSIEAFLDKGLTKTKAFEACSQQYQLSSRTIERIYYNNVAHKQSD